MQTIGEKERNAKGGRRKKTSRHVTLSCCMLSKGGERRHAPLQDEQMAESKCGDLFYISIPCCGAVDVGFHFPFFFSSSSNVILQDNGCGQCLS